MNTLVSLDTTMRCRTVFISDVHLGFHGCSADFLLDFLDHTECETLYLVGDIVDFWNLKKKRHWPKAHSDVLLKICEKARSGTRVVFVPGNHDLDPDQKQLRARTIFHPYHDGIDQRLGLQLTLVLGHTLLR